MRDFFICTSFLSIYWGLRGLTVPEKLSGRLFHGPEPIRVKHTRPGAVWTTCLTIVRSIVLLYAMEDPVFKAFLQFW